MNQAIVDPAELRRFGCHVLFRDRNDLFDQQVGLAMVKVIFNAIEFVLVVFHVSLLEFNVRLKLYVVETGAIGEF